MPALSAIPSVVVSDEDPEKVVKQRYEQQDYYVWNFEGENDQYDEENSIYAVAGRAASEHAAVIEQITEEVNNTIKTKLDDYPSGIPANATYRNGCPDLLVGKVQNGELDYAFIEVKGGQSGLNREQVEWFGKFGKYDFLPSGVVHVVQPE